MSITYKRADIRETKAQSIMLGLNARGQVEVNPLETALRDQFPVFYSEYRRLGRNGALVPGEWWYFREATPWLIGAILRDGPNSSTRLRHLEQALITLRRDWQREGLKSLAIAPLGTEVELAPIRALMEDYLKDGPIPVEFYEEFSAEG